MRDVTGDEQDDQKKKEEEELKIKSSGYGALQGTKDKSNAEQTKLKERNAKIPLPEIAEESQIAESDK